MPSKIERFDSFLGESQEKVGLKITPEFQDKIKNDFKLLNKLDKVGTLSRVPDIARHPLHTPEYPTFSIYINHKPISDFSKALDKRDINLIPDYFGGRYIVMAFNLNTDLEPGNIKIDEFNTRIKNGNKNIGVEFNANTEVQLEKVVEKAFDEVLVILSKIKITGGKFLGKIESDVKIKIKEAYKEMLKSLLTGEKVDVENIKLGDFIVASFKDYPEEILNYKDLPKNVIDEILDSSLLKHLKSEESKKLKSLRTLNHINKYY